VFSSKPKVFSSKPKVCDSKKSFHFSACFAMKMLESMQSSSFKPNTKISQQNQKLPEIDKKALATVESTPEAVKITSRDGMLPLHVTCQHGSPLEIVQYLFEQCWWPDAAIQCKAVMVGWVETARGCHTSERNPKASLALGMSRQGTAGYCLILGPAIARDFTQRGH
jgi:hypothetical protein